MAKKWAIKLSAARLRALRRMPYMASVIYALVPIQRPGLNTLGVTLDGRLFYDPEFIEAIDDEFLGGILLHESMHLIQKHFDRAVSRGIISSDMKAPVTVEGFMEARRWNIAADCEINDDLVAGGVKFPTEGPYVPALPKTFDLKDHDLAEVYYDQLKNQAENGKDQAQQDYMPKIRCGSCAGNPLPNEGQKEGEPSGRTPGDMERMRQETAQAVRAEEATKKGSVPNGLVRWADEVLAPPKVDWRRQFASRIRRSIGQRAGLVDFSYKRPSRRQAGRGDIIFPAMVTPIPVIGVIVDTSGSMSERDLGVGLGQIRHILSATRAEIYLAICDAAVHELKKVRTIHEIKASLKGGGGTDMAPAIEALDKVGCDLIVGISDCEAHWPAEPPRAKSIWLRCGNYKSDPPFGAVVDIDEGVVEPVDTDDNQC